MQLAELGLLSSAERRTVEVPELTVPEPASDAQVLTEGEAAVGSPASLTADAVAGVTR